MVRLGSFAFAALFLLVAPVAADPTPGPPGPPGPPSPGPVVELRPTNVVIDGRGTLSTDELFGIGDAKPIAKSASLDAVARALAKATPLVRIECHTDDTAPDNDHSGAWQRDLSQRRADAVKAYLVKQGVPANRLVA